MCTVTFIPQAGGFILTSNRDEDPNREMALPPELYDTDGGKLIFPKDPRGGGSWICTSSSFTLCLLNGADRFHEKRGPYRHSRGLVVLNFYEYDGVEDFNNRYDLTDVEPFTLVVVDHQQSVLHQLRWNGISRELRRLNWNQAHIWSSFTLYPEEIIEQREQWFDDFLAKHSQGQEDVLNFHRFGGTGDIQHDLVMSRHGRVMTISITQITYGSTHHIRYYDLRKDSMSDQVLNEVWQ